VVRRQHQTNTWGWLGRRFPPRFSTCLLGRHSPQRACVWQWWSLHACSPHARTNKSQHRRHNANDGHWCRDEFVFSTQIKPLQICVETLVSVSSSGLHGMSRRKLYAFISTHTLPPCSYKVILRLS